MKIGKWLLEETKDRKLIGFLSERLEVTPRTLRNWKKQAKTEVRPKIGRPSYSQEQRDKAKIEIVEQMRLQGYPGWRPTSKALPHIPKRLLQEKVSEIKVARRRHIRAELRRNQIRTEVVAREAVWSLDGTFLRKKRDGQTQVIKDRGSLAYRAVEDQKTSSTDNVVRIFKNLKQEHGLPLVCSTDNGSNYCSERMRHFFEQEKIVHLKSLPRTPQHNGAIEVGIRAFKQACDLEVLQGSLIDATDIAKNLNNYKINSSKQLKTSSQLDEELVVAYTKVSREEFYERCMNRVWRVRESTLTHRRKRHAEREVIFKTLEEYGLVKRMRANRPLNYENVEIFL